MVKQRDYCWQRKKEVEVEKEEEAVRGEDSKTHKKSLELSSS